MSKDCLIVFFLDRSAFIKFRVETFMSHPKLERTLLLPSETLSLLVFRPRQDQSGEIAFRRGKRPAEMDS